jgi:serine phosphatase RsbU (regulator of sigma subunit)
MSTSPSGLSRADVGQLVVLSGLSGGWNEVRELLSRIRTELAADEAALLLMDTAGLTLIPVAAVGLDTPTRSGFRVPVGAGFAGRVAAGAKPVILTDVNPATVLNPALHRRGVRSLLGVPVQGPTGVLGVVHVGSVTAREFSADDTARLEELAAELATEVLRRRFSEEHIAALALQRSLLPSTTPRIDGLDIAARYVPADGDLGGDWYDVFRLPDDRIGIVMGDVAGHGLAAAVVMGRLRSALRAYALEHTDPAKVLGLLDAKISYFEAGAVATVLYAVAEPPYECFRVSSAGHLPPTVVTAERTSWPADVAPDPPLGVRVRTSPWTRHVTEVELPPGGSLCFFTDGLVERRPSRGSDSDQISAGLERLLVTMPPGSADTACVTVLTDLIGEAIAEDDIAILVVRRLV